MPGGPNSSFKPNLLRYTNNMAEGACHVVGSATQVGLTQALCPTEDIRMPSIDLKQSALRLVELGRLIVRAYIEWDSEKIAQLATEFAETKRLVQIHLIENPAVQLPGADAAEARAVLRKIASGEPLPAEEALIGKIVDCGFDTVDFDEIGTDELYSWMSHIDYAEGLYQAGALIVACGTLPKELSTYVNEARQCFAF